MTTQLNSDLQAADESVVLHLILPADQVNDVVDCLLAEQPALFFSVLDVQGYGQPQERLTVREQVAGYQKKVMVQIECHQSMSQQILANIKHAMPTATISYRILPLIEHGQL